MAWCDPCAADPLSGKEMVELGARWLGDGVVSLDSATARDVQGDLRCATIGNLHHVHMLQEPRVYAQLVAWLVERRRRRVARRACVLIGRYELNPRKLRFDL